MGNPFVHVELATTDVGQATSFSQSLFDWSLPHLADLGAPVDEDGVRHANV